MGALDTLPVSYKVRGRRIVIVGGGEQALAKARLAAKTSARTVVVCREVRSDFATLPVTVQARPFREADLDGAALVFVADHVADGEAAKVAARRRGIPVNVVDVAGECDFYIPSVIERAPVSIAIASEGRAPVLARLLRARIEAVLPVDVGALAALAGSMREKVTAALPGARARRYYEALLTSPAVELALERGTGRQAAEALLAAHVNAGGDTAGAVWLIGAGPGAEDLLTLRAQRLLQEADVIVHDRLVSDAVIDMGRRDAERIAVDLHRISRVEAGALLARLAREGRRVARLVSGDPAMSGRASEEIATVRRAGVVCTIVPGVSAPAAEPDLKVA